MNFLEFRKTRIIIKSVNKTLGTINKLNVTESTADSRYSDSLTQLEGESNKYIFYPYEYERIDISTFPIYSSTFI